METFKCLVVHFCILSMLKQLLQLQLLVVVLRTWVSLSIKLILLGLQSLTNSSRRCWRLTGFSCCMGRLWATACHASATPQIYRGSSWKLNSRIRKFTNSSDTLRFHNSTFTIILPCIVYLSRYCSTLYTLQPG